jgi:hypothetical protein
VRALRQGLWPLPLPSRLIVTLTLDLCCS